MSAAADSLLRPALEAAIAVARAGYEETPQREAPPELRPFLRFAKLPPRALAVARKVLDEDAGFRDLVAEDLVEDDVGRAPWLFLARPEGWEAELAALVGAAAQAESAAAEEREERDARRRLAGAEQALRRAEEVAAAARQEAAQAVAALAEERRARAAAVAEVAGLARARDRAATERDQAARREQAAAAERDALRARVRELEQDLRATRDALPPVPVPEPEPEPEPEVEPAPGRAAELGDAAAAMAGAAQAAADLAARLAEVAAGLGWTKPGAGAGAAGAGGVGAGGVGAGGPAAGGPTDPASRSGPARPRTRTRTRRRPPARAPAALPPGVFDDSPEAAEHLLRTPAAILVIDGYNATLSIWPDRPLTEQRQRLLDALSRLGARTGCDVRVVFDGSEEATPSPALPAPRGVRVTFSAGGEEADDVIERLVGALPVDRTVVVASSDHRVRDDAAGHGANVISTAQLAAVLRR